MPLLGGAKIKKCIKCTEKDVPSTFLIGNLYTYSLAFRFGFKLPLNPLVAEVLRHVDFFPHRVVSNTWRVITAVLTLNARLDVELGLDGLLYLLQNL